MSILKDCDMVLVLSEDTINFQFKSLYENGLIPQEWNVLVSEEAKKAYIFFNDKEEGKQILVNDNTSKKDQNGYDVQIITKKEEFDKIKNGSDSIENINTAIKNLEEERDKALDENKLEEAKKIKDSIKVKKSELESLFIPLYAWEAKFEPPIIEIIPNNNSKELLFKITFQDYFSRLLFKITFQGGQLTYYQNGEKNTYKLTGTKEKLGELGRKYTFLEQIKIKDVDKSAAKKINELFDDKEELKKDWYKFLPTFIKLLVKGKLKYVKVNKSLSEKELETWLKNLYSINASQYVFKVPIGRLEINEAGKILHKDARDAVNKIIRDKGLTVEDFTIESIYLDYQRADISDFDQGLTNLPSINITEFQVAITNFFQRVLRGSQHPYILGYGLTVKKFKEIPKAKFEPKSLRFSTTYDEDSQYSALNFLMMVEKPEFPPNADLGTFDKSLIRKTQDVKTTPVDEGVILIDKSLFIKRIFEDDIIPIIAECVNNVFPNNSKAYYKKEEKQDFYEWNLLLELGEQSKSYEKDSKDYTVFSKIKIKSTIKLEFIENKIELTATFDAENNCDFHEGQDLKSPKVGSAFFSTQGNYEKVKFDWGIFLTKIPNGIKKGQQGQIKFIIQPGVEGKIAVSTSEFKELIMGLAEVPKTRNILINDEEDLKNYPEWVKSFIKGLDDFTKHQTPVGLVIEMLLRDSLNLQLDGFAGVLSREIHNSSSQLKTAIETSIDSISNSIIFPLGQVYTYKDIYLCKDEKNDAIMMKLSYAPKYKV